MLIKKSAPCAHWGVMSLLRRITVEQSRSRTQSALSAVFHH